jgi:hypothetical protein
MIDRKRLRMILDDPFEVVHRYLAYGDDDSGDDYEDQAADEQSEDSDDRGSDPEPVQRD